MYLYIIFYALRHFFHNFKQKCWVFWFDLPKNFEFWNTHCSVSYSLIYALVHTCPAMANCWQWRLIEIWGQVIWNFMPRLYSLQYLANISVWLFSIELKQGVASKLLSCKYTFSQIFSDSPSCNKHCTPSLHFPFPIFKHLWCYFFVIEFFGWNQLFEINKSKNLMLYSMPNNFQHLSSCVDAILSARLYKFILQNHRECESPQNSLTVTFGM